MAKAAMEATHTVPRPSPRDPLPLRILNSKRSLMCIGKS